MRAVLFDLDGTLLTLPVAIEPVRERLRAELGARGYRGELRPILAAIEQASGQVAATDDERRRLIAEARAAIDRAEVEAAASARATAGAAAVVAELGAGGVAVGIVTDNGRACVAPALATAGIEADWRVIVSRDDVAAGKPDPAGVVQAARALLPAGGQLTLVGDSPRDIEAGRGARGRLPGIELAIVAVTCGRGRPDQLAGADRVIADLRAL